MTDAATLALTLIAQGVPDSPWIVVFGLILAWLAREGIPAAFKWRTTRLAERQYEDTEAKAAYGLLVTELTARVQSLANDLKAVQHDHVQCIEKQARLEGRDEQRAKELDLLREEVKELRKWRHDVANQTAIVSNKAEADKLEAANAGKAAP